MKYLGYAYDHAFKELLDRRHQSRIGFYYKKCIKIWGFDMISSKNKLKRTKQLFSNDDLKIYEPDAAWRDSANK